MVEKVFLLVQIFEMEILMDLHSIKTPESENHIFIFGLGVSVCLTSIIQKRITVEISDLLFYLCSIYICYFKFFYKDRTKTLCQGHKKNFKTLRPIGGISCY